MMIYNTAKVGGSKSSGALDYREMLSEISSVAPYLLKELRLLIGLVKRLIKVMHLKLEDMYERGKSAARDYVMAMMWYNVAYSSLREEPYPG